MAVAAKRSKPLGQALKDAKTHEQRLAIIKQLSRDQQISLWNALVKSLPEEERAKVQAMIEELATNYRPQTPEELHEFVKSECGIDVPRAAVCHNHCAPFTLLEDVYFEKGNPDKLAVGNRGSGKTQIMGAIHAVSARTKPKWSGATVGAVLQQANRCYGYFREIVGQGSWLPFTKKGRVNMGGTQFKNDSFVEILTGTITGVNSPHPVLAHLDEVELLRTGVYEEALNMAQSKNGYRAMNVLTSSWKLPTGFVTQLMDSVEEAKREGHHPPYQLYRWCVFETTKQCQDDCSACPFANVVKGKWEDGSPRTFEQVCKQASPEEGVGKLKFSRGFVEVEDAIARFRKLSRRMWEAQQESKRPTAEGLVYDNFDEERHTLDWWTPDPEFGPVNLSVDFGGTAPHAIGFWQGPLRVEVDLRGKRIPEGAFVLFDQVYAGNLGNVEAGKLVCEKLEFWDDQHPGLFEGFKIYGDPAAKAARLDWNRLHMFNDRLRNLPVVALGSVQVDERVALVYDELIGRDLLYVDRMRCPSFLDEIGAYERDADTKKIVRENDHFMDSMGYLFWNLHVRKRKRDTRSVVPIADYRRSTTSDGRHGRRSAAADFLDEGVVMGDLQGRRSNVVRYAPRHRGMGF